jgi:hypothetical protein
VDIDPSCGLETGWLGMNSSVHPVRGKSSNSTSRMPMGQGFDKRKERDRGMNDFSWIKAELCGLKIRQFLRMLGVVGRRSTQFPIFKEQRR